MPGNKYNGYTDLGVGLGLRIPHYKKILSEKTPVDWFEIISENFISLSGRPREVLDTILESYPVVQHGVSLYFGDRKPYERTKLLKLKKLIEHTGTPFLSDHLCWGSARGVISHDLLPLPYTKEAVKNTAERIAFIRDFLEIPVCVENVSSYIEYTESTMTEWQFLAEVLENSDCGMLLDLNNVYVSSKNHGFDSLDYLKDLPLDRVAQIHLAGPSDMGTFLLDTHSSHPPEEVWQLYKHVIKITGPVNTLIEWDSAIPPLEEILTVADRAKNIVQECHPK